MKKIVLMVISTSLLIFLCSVAYGGSSSTDGANFSTQISPLSTEASQEELSKLVMALKAQASLFASVITFEGHSDFNRLDSTDYIAGKLHLMYNLRKYVFEFDGCHLPGGSYSSLQYAFDGTTRQELNKNTGILYLSTSANMVAIPLVGQNHFLLPYSYFTNEERSTYSGVILEPKDLADPALWEDFTTHLDLKGTAMVRNKKTLVAETTMGFNAFNGKSGKVRFYFDPQVGYYPVGWDCVDTLGKLLEVYRITEIGWSEVKSGVKLPYPKTAVREFYWKTDPTGLKVFDKPQNTYEIHVTSLKVNLSLPDETFVIDPSLASQIVDQASKDVITVPK